MKRNFVKVLTMMALALLICQSGMAQDSLKSQPFIYMTAAPLSDGHVTILKNKIIEMLYYFIGGDLNGIKTKVVVEDTGSEIKQVTDILLWGIRYTRFLIYPRRPESDNLKPSEYTVKLSIYTDDPSRYMYVPEAIDPGKPLYQDMEVVYQNAIWKKTQLDDYFIGSRHFPAWL